MSRLTKIRIYFGFKLLNLLTIVMKYTVKFIDKYLIGLKTKSFSLNSHNLLSRPVNKLFTPADRSTDRVNKVLSSPEALKEIDDLYSGKFDKWSS
jgi:hypothetical protein